MKALLILGGIFAISALLNLGLLGLYELGKRWHENRRYRKGGF